MSPSSRAAYQFTLTAAAHERLEELVSKGFAPNRSLAVERLILGPDGKDAPPALADGATGPKSWLDGTWDQHLDRILQKHGRKSTTGHPILISGPGSYEAEYRACKAAFGDGTSSFASLDVEDRMLIAGTGGGSNGFFGNMRPAAPFRPLITHAAGAVQIAKFLDRIPFSKNDAIPLEEIREVLLGLVSIHGMGLGTASRLLAAKRPDVFLPVNGANIAHVCANIRRVRADSLAHRVSDYLELLVAVRETEWFNSSAPAKGTDDRWIWFARVAMLDARLYAVRP